MMKAFRRIASRYRGIRVENDISKGKYKRLVGYLSKGKEMLIDDEMNLIQLLVSRKDNSLQKLVKEIAEGEEKQKEEILTANRYENEKLSILTYLILLQRYDVLEYLLKNININLTLNNSMSILHAVLASGGDISSTVSYLLQNGLDYNRQDGDGNTPLHIAAMMKDEASVKMLMSMPKINVNLVNALGRSPLQEAFMYSTLDIIKQLEKRTTPQNKRSVLHYSIMNEDSTVFEYALSKYADQKNAVLHHLPFSYPVHYAASKPKKYALEQMLTTESAGYKDKEGNNVLHIAIQCKSLECIRYIIQTQKELLKVPNSYGVTPEDLLKSMSDILLQGVDKF